MKGFGGREQLRASKRGNTNQTNFWYFQITQSSVSSLLRSFILALGIPGLNSYRHIVFPLGLWGLLPHCPDNIPSSSYLQECKEQPITIHGTVSILPLTSLQTFSHRQDHGDPCSLPPTYYWLGNSICYRIPIDKYPLKWPVWHTSFPLQKDLSPLLSHSFLKIFYCYANHHTLHH